MAENKTKPNASSVEEYIESRGGEQQRRDCQELMKLLGAATREPPVMWGLSIVGFGACRYAYESGRTGEAPLAAFAIRGARLVIYLHCEGEVPKRLLSRLGRHSMGKSCLYFRRLSDLDGAVLKQLIDLSIEAARPEPR